VREAYGLDALRDDPELSGITRFAAALFEVPISLVSLLIGDTQHFLGRQGPTSSRTRAAPRSARTR
jgi:hypothetical protein